MGAFSKIPVDTFQMIQKNAGVLLRNFDPTKPTFDDADIIGATTGGFQFSAVPSFVDMGEDIDNCPKGTKELMDVDTWDVTASGTYVALSGNNMTTLMAAADIEPVISQDTNARLVKLTPRNNLTDMDFRNLWWVGDRGGTDGNFIALHLINAINTGGFSLKTQDNGKGQFSFSYSCHPSINDQGKVPFEVYVMDPKEE